MKGPAQQTLEKKSALIEKQENEPAAPLNELDAERTKHENAALKLLGLGPDVEIWDPEKSEYEGEFVCDYQLRDRLQDPGKLKRLKADAHLMKHWPALQQNFRARAYPITPAVGAHLLKTAAPGDSGFAAALETAS